jgi:AsmA protein
VFDPITGSRDKANLGLTRRLDLDLRLSARQASVGPVKLSELAATAQTREGFAVFDVSDAQALGGRVQAGMRFSAAAQGTNIDANFGGSDIDGGQLGKVAGMTRILPQSRGNVSVTMKGPVQSWSTFINRLDGKIAANFGAGPISNLDLAKLRAQIAKGKVFSLDAAGNASTSVDAFKLNAAVANNMATLKDTSIQASDSLIQLDGVVSFEGRGLALNGTLSDAKAQGNATPSASFRVGGTWSEPFVSPLPAPAAPD